MKGSCRNKVRPVRCARRSTYRMEFTPAGTDGLDPSVRGEVPWRHLTGDLRSAVHELAGQSRLRLILNPFYRRYYRARGWASGGARRATWLGRCTAGSSFVSEWALGMPIEYAFRAALSKRKPR